MGIDKNGDRVSEQPLVRRLKAGDRAAIAEMIEGNGTRLLKTAFLLCGDESDAQDLVQDTFLKAIDLIGKFREESKLHTWLYGILFNLNRSMRRKRRLLFPGQLPEETHDPMPAFEQKMDLQKVYRIISGIMKKMAAKHREVLVLRYFEAMSLMEISDTLGISIGTVKSRLFYATSKIRNKLPADLNLFGSGDT